MHIFHIILLVFAIVCLNITVAIDILSYLNNLTGNKKVNIIATAWCLINLFVQIYFLK